MRKRKYSWLLACFIFGGANASDKCDRYYNLGKDDKYECDMKRWRQQDQERMQKEQVDIQRKQLEIQHKMLEIKQRETESRRSMKLLPEVSDDLNELSRKDLAIVLALKEGIEQIAGYIANWKGKGCPDIKQAVDASGIDAAITLANSSMSEKVREYGNVASDITEGSRMIYQACIRKANSPTNARITSNNSNQSNLRLFDTLTKPNYLQAWSALFKSEKGVDPWLSQLNKSKSGVTSTVEHFAIENVAYQLYKVCEPHNCSDNKFTVIFPSNGVEAWGLHIKDKKERFYGNPDEATRYSLREAAHR